MSLLLAALIAAQPIIIDSHRVEFRGQTLRLSENVSIKNEMGHFMADLIDWEESAERLHMKGHVRCKMSDGASLDCESAECDLAKLHLKLEGGVLLNDARHSLQTNKMYVELSEAKHIHSLILEQEVKFQFQNELALAADRATYQRSGEDSDEPLFGVLKLNGNCEFSNPFGDHLSAGEISLDTVNHKTIFKDPKGAFCAGGKLEVSAERLLWDRNENKMVLQQNVKATLQEMGRFDVKEDLTLSYQVADGKRELKKLECRGETHLTVEDSKKKYGCNFTCYGSMCLDRETQLITMSSPVNAAGFTERGSQVFFQDGLAKMAADTVTLSFVEEKVLDKVVLEGRVQLINRLAQFSDEETPLQYALADAIEYLPRTKELNLISNGKQRVLFQDSINHIQISAPALKIKRSTPVQRGYIQGVGDVRFSFAKNEVDLLKETFWQGGA